MCNPTVMAVANFGLQTATAYTEYQGQQAAVDAQNKANTLARRDSKIAYGEDLSRLEAQRIQENEDAARESMIIQRDKAIALSKARASAGEGKGEVMAMLRDIGYEADYDSNLLQSQVDYSNRQINQGRDDAYAAMQRVFNSLSTPTPPSAIGLGLQIGSAGLGSYAKFKSGEYGEKE